MKKKLFLSFLSAATLSAAAFFGFQTTKFFTPERENNFSEFEEREEESAKRREWEFMRLHDPVTNTIPEDIRARELAFATEQKELFRKKYSSLLNSEEATTWIQRGPSNIGGRTRALALDVENEQIMLAGGVSGGMWRSTNGGTSWTKVITPDQLHSVSCIAQDTRPGKTKTWYYGTGEIRANSADGGGGSPYRGDGVFKSTDNGLTWKQLDSTISGKPHISHKFNYVHSIVTDPANTSQDVVYIAAGGSIYRSSNGGNSWLAVISSNGEFSDVAITSEGVLYAAISSDGGSARGVWRSTDGINWKNITPTSWPSVVNRTVIGISPSDETVYFLSNSPGSGLQVVINGWGNDATSLFRYKYKSGDGSGTGGEWINRSQNLPLDINGQKDYYSYQSYCMDIAVSPENPNVVFVAGVELFRSNDGFATKGATSYVGGYGFANHHPDIHTLVFSQEFTGVLYSGDDGGVHKATGALGSNISWIALNSGYITSQFYTVAIDQQTSGSNIIIGGLQDNNTIYTNTTNVGTAWKKIGDGDGAFCAIANGGTFYLTSSQNGYLLRQELDNTGKNISSVFIRPNALDGALFINPFALDPADNNVLYFAGYNHLWRNDDVANATSSTGWTKLTNTNTGSFGVISAVGVSKTPENVVYYGTSFGKVFRLVDANTGNPGPVNVSSTKFPGGAYVSCIAVDPTNANKAIVVFSNYNVQSLFYTQDAGKNWTSISGTLEENPSSGVGAGPSCRWVSILPMGGNTTMYYVGTSTGLYSTSFLNGNSTVWKQEGADVIGNTVVDMIATRQSDKLVVVATHGAGVFSGKAGVTVKAPTAPTLLSPANNTRGVSTSQELTWNSAGTGVGYDLQISTSPTFSTIFAEQEGLTTNSYIIKNLDQGKKQFYWRVRTTNESGASAYTNAWSFTTAIAAPTLSSPKNAQASLSQKTTFTWNAVSGASMYRLMISSNSSFSDTLADIKNISGTTYTLTDTLQSDKRHYWRVSSTDADGESMFSSPWNFRTEKVLINSVEENFSLTNIFSQNYPNPFVTNTKIVFNNDRAQRVTVKIFDVNGKEISILADREFPSGEQSLEFFSGNLPGGMYFYTISYSGKTLTKAMQIVR